MSTFHEEKEAAYTTKLRAILKELPPFCGLYFRAMESTTSILTRYGYAVDLRNFFRFCLKSEDVSFAKGKQELKELTLNDLNAVQTLDIELYLEHVTLYVEQEEKRTNKERAKARKLSALRSFFKYYYKQHLIENNVVALVETPKIHEKAIVRLDVNEVADLIDRAEDGSGLSKHQQRFHNATKLRDVAIVTLFLGSGIRISELVGIDLNDIDFERDTFLITRKGGNQDVLPFGTEVRNALLLYYEERMKAEPLPGHEQAFFLSMQRRRITVRAVENLVKKYANLAAPLKPISPHKLRSTYGTMLYQESGDIYLVADVLGHKDVNTTRKHYAAMSEDRKRLAAKMIHLREESSDLPPQEEH